MPATPMPEPSLRAESAGYELPLLLFGGFRTLIDQLHAQLARQGHPNIRPAHGFAMQAIGLQGATASEVGRRLGVSKQAAATRNGPTTRRMDGANWSGSRRTASTRWAAPR
jgi:hypothetical protein